MENTALVIIDLQNDITKNYREIIANVNEAAAFAKSQNMHILYVRHENAAGSFKTGTRGAAFVPELNVVSENVFVKNKASVLTCEAFRTFIQNNGVTRFVLTGADASACIKSACINLKKEGFSVGVLSDCVTSYDKQKLPELFAYYAKKGASVQVLSGWMREE